MTAILWLTDLDSDTILSCFLHHGNGRTLPVGRGKVGCFSGRFYLVETRARSKRGHYFERGWQHTQPERAEKVKLDH